MKPLPVLKAVGKAMAVFVIVAWSLFPIAIIVLSAFKFDRDIFRPDNVFVFEPTLNNFVNLVSRWPDFFSALANSLIVTSGATVLAVLVSTLAGYALSRYRARLLNASVVFLVVIRLIPPIVVTLPLFPIVNQLRLSDTHILLIVLYATFFVSLGALVMRTFIDQIPRELDDAARMDGAGPIQVLRSVILPLSGQGMVAVAVFVAIFAWNEYLFAFIFSSVRSRTAPIVLSEMMGALDGIEWGVLFAASTTQLIPVLIFVVAMQRFLVSGLTAGAVKG